MEKCDALDTDDLVSSTCLLGKNSLSLLVSDNCGSTLNSEPPSRPLFGPFVALSSVALYIRVIPLDLGHMSSSSFVLYRSQNLFPLLLPRKGSIMSTSHTLPFIVNNPNFFSRIGNPDGKVICYALETEESGFDTQQHAKDYVFSKESRSIMGPTRLPLQSETVANQPKREADYSHLSSAEDKNVCSYS